MIKKSGSEEIIRVYYTAFLYSEYVLRKFLLDYPGVGREIKEFQTDMRSVVKDICNISTQIDPAFLLDRLIENEAFLHSEEYGCDVFAGAIHERFQKSLQSVKNYDVYKVFDSLDIILRKVPQVRDFIKSLVVLSLELGVYVSHADKIKNGYKIDKIINMDKEYLMQHIFFKNDVCLNLKSNFIKFKEHIYEIADIDENVPGASSTDESQKLISDDEQEESKEKWLKIYVDVNHREYGVNDSLDMVRRALIALKFKSVDKMVENYDQCRDVVDVYFEKSLLRSSTEEVLKKIFGILLADASEKKLKIKDVMFEINKKYGIRIKEGCSEECNSECPDIDICCRMAQKLREVACMSIENGKIVTSKGIKN